MTRQDRSRTEQVPHPFPPNRRRYPIRDDDMTFTRDELLRARTRAPRTHVVLSHAA